MKICLEHLDADLINPSCPPVALNVLERLVHEYRGDSTGQRMNFEFQPVLPHKTSNRNTFQVSRKRGGQAIWWPQPTD